MGKRLKLTYIMMILAVNQLKLVALMTTAKTPSVITAVNETSEQTVD